MTIHRHRYVEGPARSNGTLYSRYEVCEQCGLVHEWGGDEATGQETHRYRAAGFDEFGMGYEPTAVEPPCAN
jgi:hypothetical protein